MLSTYVRLQIQSAHLLAKLAGKDQIHNRLELMGLVVRKYQVSFCLSARGRQIEGSRMFPTLILVLEHVHPMFQALWFCTCSQPFYKAEWTCVCVGIRLIADNAMPTHEDDCELNWKSFGQELHLVCTVLDTQLALMCWLRSIAILEHSPYWTMMLPGTK